MVGRPAGYARRDLGQGLDPVPGFPRGGGVPVRAGLPDAFLHTDLAADLHARAVREVVLLALPGVPELAATAQAAQDAGFSGRVLDALIPA